MPSDKLHVEREALEQRLREFVEEVVGETERSHDIESCSKCVRDGYYKIPGFINALLAPAPAADPWEEAAELFAADLTASEFWDECEENGLPTETARAHHRAVFARHAKAIHEPRPDAREPTSGAGILREAFDAFCKTYPGRGKTWDQKAADFVARRIDEAVGKRRVDQWKQDWAEFGVALRERDEARSRVAELAGALEFYASQECHVLDERGDSAYDLDDGDKAREALGAR